MNGRRNATVVLLVTIGIGACGGGRTTIGLKSKQAQLEAETSSSRAEETSTTSAGGTPISVSASTSATAVARPGTTSPATTKVPPPPTTTAGSRPATVTVTEADDGKSYALRRGDRLVVQLGPGYSWTEPASSNEAVLARTSGSTNGDGSAQGTFTAVGGGTAEVTATGTAPPSPCRTAKPPCMMPDYARQFRVSVSVS